MIDPKRLTTIRVKELTVANLYNHVLCDGHAGQLLGWDSEAPYFYLLLGPAERDRKFLVTEDTEIQILDNEEMRPPVVHWAV